MILRAHYDMCEEWKYDNYIENKHDSLPRQTADDFTQLCTKRDNTKLSLANTHTTSDQRALAFSQPSTIGSTGMPTTADNVIFP